MNSYREGADLILYLDRGSAAGVKSGMTGFMLGEGDKPVDGGTIKITKVVDATKCIAKTPIAKVPPKTVVVINLVK